MAEALGTGGGYVAPVGSGYSDPRDGGGSGWRCDTADQLRRDGQAGVDGALLTAVEGGVAWVGM